MREVEMPNLLRAAAVAAALLVPTATRADDAGDIRALMMAAFDRPEVRLSVDPVTVQGDLAIAGWVQGDMGGLALLRREQGGWELSLCAGDALRDPSALQQLGLSPTEARTLAAAVAASEADVDPARLATFARFEGIVTARSTRIRRQTPRTTADERGRVPREPAADAARRDAALRPLAAPAPRDRGARPRSPLPARARLR
jgi:hypothetical protein